MNNTYIQNKLDEFDKLKDKDGYNSDDGFDFGYDGHNMTRVRKWVENALALNNSGQTNNSISTLDELIPTDVDLLMTPEQKLVCSRQAIVNLFTDYHNHIVEKFMEIEQNKQKGHYHPVWNKAKRNTVQELKASLLQTNATPEA